MFKARLATNHFLLFHNEACLNVQTLRDCQDLEVVTNDVAFQLTYLYFLETDGEPLAEVKANMLYQYVANGLPHQLEFELEDQQLERVIMLALGQNAARFFDEYCSQQLYIRTLHSLVASHDDASVARVKMT